MNEIVKKNGIKFGIISGVISILATVFIYLIDLKLFTSLWLGLSLILIYIGIGIYMMINTKKELNGNFLFKDAFTTYFLYAVIGIAFSVIFNIILFNFIDPSAKETIKELSIEAAVSMMQKFNTPTDVIKTTVEEMQNKNQFETLELLKGSVWNILFSAIFAAIFAAIFKSKSKEQF